MLNISKNSISKNVDTTAYTSFSRLNNFLARKIFLRTLLGVFLLFTFLLFLPWTQNVQGDGQVISLRPEERPQTIQNVIAGKIERWYVSEGQRVNRGDTILFISEVKTEYFDPELIERVREQVNAKASGINAYENKLKALDNQLSTLSDLQKLKIRTVDNKIKQEALKVKSDSANWKASEIDYATALQRLERQEEMYKSGLISLTDLESRRLKLQETKAKMISAENKYGQSVNSYINVLIEQDQVVSEFGEKISDVQAKKSSAGSELYAGLSEMAKTKNQLENYKLRQSMYYIKAPIDGIVTQAISVGIGENIKENSPIVTIVPIKWQKAVEVYVAPINLPLIKKGNEMMFLFDGWPTVVFSGWPQLTYGTFMGEVQAVDYTISQNGKYRVLVAETDRQKWPDELRIGSGARGIALLNTVPVWYELWRQLSGFPPDYYKGVNDIEVAVKK